MRTSENMFWNKQLMSLRRPFSAPHRLQEMGLWALKLVEIAVEALGERVVRKRLGALPYMRLCQPPCGHNRNPMSN